MKCQRSAILQQFEKPETDSFDLSEVERGSFYPQHGFHRTPDKVPGKLNKC